ncbi:MAG TPA: DUF1444 family protein [Gaiellaceae bacterium]
MRAGLASLLFAVLVAATAGCSGKDNSSPRLLSTADFKNKVAAAIITGSDLDAEPGFGAKVNVSSKTSLNTLALRFPKEYADYRAHPDRLNSVVRALVERAKRRMALGNEDESFAEARSLILPVLKPKGSFRRLAEQPATTPFPGDLRVAYAVQRPDSFMLVNGADIARWKQPLSEIHRLAVANIVRETKRDQPLKCEEKLCGWASGDGYDASRMIAPELRREIVRKIGPAVYAVPRESVFVALPIKLAARIRSKVTRDFVTAPNPVSPDIFVERGGELVVLPQ